MKIAYLGPIGSYSYEAILKYKRNEDTLVECDTTTKVIESLKNNVVDSCIIPIENILYDGLVDAKDVLYGCEDINIIDEISLEVRHVLMSKEKDSQIARIYSHSKVLEECKDYILDNYSQIETIDVVNTAYAAKIASKESGTACICNMICKDLYNLEVVSEKVQGAMTSMANFFILSKTKNTRKTEKTSVIFSTKDEPGALYKILGIFSVSDINLSKIESRASNSNEYLFFVDVQGDEKDEKVKLAFEDVKRHCNYFRIIGSY